MKLLDGTYTDKSIQIGTGANQVFRLGVSSTDSSTLGAFQSNSANEAVSSTSAATAKSALNLLFSGAADYTVKGSFGTTTASVDAGADARDVAKTFNLLTGTTGISASVITKAKVQAGDATTYSFTITTTDNAGNTEQQ